MARTKSSTTKHTCGGPTFGRLAPRGECRRCDELRFGAPPVEWAKGRDALRCEEIRSHFASAKHQSGGCGPVCTFGEW